MITAVGLAAVLLAMPARAALRDSSDVELQKMLIGRSSEASVSCIDLGYASNVSVIEGKAIVYRVGRRLFVNTPTDPSRLRRDDILVTSSLGSRLCSNDVIQLVSSRTEIPHGFVKLTNFVPFSKRP